MSLRRELAIGLVLLLVASLAPTGRPSAPPRSSARTARARRCGSSVRFTGGPWPSPRRSAVDRPRRGRLRRRAGRRVRLRRPRRAQRLRHPRRGRVRARHGARRRHHPRRDARPGPAALRETSAWRWPWPPASPGCSSPSTSGGCAGRSPRSTRSSSGCSSSWARSRPTMPAPGRRDHRARRDHRRRRRRAARHPRAAARPARPALDAVRTRGTDGGGGVRSARHGQRRARAGGCGCLAVVFVVRMLALARGWQSPAPIVGAPPRGDAPLTCVPNLRPIRAALRRGAQSYT